MSSRSATASSSPTPGIVYDDDIAARWRVEYTDGKFQNREFKVGDFYVTNGTERDPGLLYLYRNSPNTWGVITWHWYPGTIIRWHDNRDSVPPGSIITGVMADVFVPYDFEYQLPNPTEQGEGGTTDGFQLENYRLNWWNTLANPTKDNPGHEFKAGEQLVPTASHPVFGHQYTDLYAQWAPIRYTFLKFKADGATGGAADIVGDAGEDKLIPDYNKGQSDTDHFYLKGYDIVGWNTKADGSGTTYQAGDLYRLRWESVPDLGIDVEVKEVVGEDDKITLIAEQWLYAIWAPHGGFVLQYNMGGGSPAMPRQDRDSLGSDWPRADVTPTRDGYEFLGWFYKYDDAGNFAPIDDSTPYYTIARGVDDNMISNTLYARWKPGKIQIDYMADGNGTVSSRETADDKKTAYEIVNLDVDNPNNLDIGGAIAEAGTGYHFVNWTNSMDSQTGKYDSLARGDILSVIRDNTGAYHPVTFIAHFAANQYNVRYFANGGEGSLDDMRATYGVYLQLAVGGTVEGIFREGYSFAGWNTKADGSGTSYKSGGRVNDFVGDHGSTITLYAMWAELETRIEFTAAPVAGGVVPLPTPCPRA